MEEKRNISEEDIKKSLSGVAEILKPLLGKVFYTDSTVVEILENGDISVTGIYETTIVYRAMSDSWSILLELLSNFDNNAKTTIDKFFSIVAIPVVVSLPVANADYFESVVNSFSFISEKSKSRPAEEIVENARIFLNELLAK